MKAQEVLYLGRLVAKEGFRVFVYGANQAKKLVNSYVEYEIHKATGDWFDSFEEFEAAKKPALVVTEPVDEGKVVKDDAPVLEKKGRK